MTRTIIDIELENRVRELEARVHKLEHPFYCADCNIDFSDAEALGQHKRSSRAHRGSLSYDQR